MLQEMLKERGVPKLGTKVEMLEVMQQQVYGFIPAAPKSIRFEEKKKYIPNFCAGKATCTKVTAVCEMEEGEFSFPFYFTCPTAEGKYPFFVHINFRADVPDRYQPTEEIIDNGFAVLSFNYKDVTSDDESFSNGLAGVLYKNKKRGASDAGKIAMWAWAAHRVMDYAQMQENLDGAHGIVCGHSRLGKTALLASATDERFFAAYSNDSGCSGAAITRNKQGETVRDICTQFPYWFCENYYAYINREETMPFDQHWLIACCAPRYVLVGSASEDLWADPDSEMLACAAASDAFKGGFVSEDRLPQIDDKFFAGDIGYHLRRGLHYFGRQDWHRLIEFVRRKMK